MRLQLPGGYGITDIEAGDRGAYIEHLNDKDIYRQTLAIPFPYDDAAADSWLAFVRASTEENGGRPVVGAIRNPAGKLIGGIGFDGLVIGKAHRAELGYWLARPYWRKGVMTEAVGAMCDFAFEHLGLVKITANIFTFNVASQRVLEKNGFNLEGTHPLHYLKEGEFFDGKLFGRLKTVAHSEKVPRPEFIKHYAEIQDPESDSHYEGSDEILALSAEFTKHLGLQKLGIGVDTLLPGRRSSWPHAHSREEEFIYVIEGNPDAWLDGSLHRLRPGDGIGFPSGTGITHCFINNTDSIIRLLIVGERIRPGDTWFYALHPEQNEKIRAKGKLWTDPPRRPMGSHDGLPDALRAKA